MIVVLCHPDDAAASWLHRTWLERGVGPIELVSVEQVAYSRRIVHRLDAAGDRGEVALADGRVLRLADVTGVINRVRHLPTEHFAAAGEGDRAYATEELYAWLLAWLDAFPGRVLNRARPYSLNGGDLPAPSFLHYAAVAGLPAGPWRMAAAGQGPAVMPDPEPPTHAVVVFDGRVHGAIVPASIQDACRRLAALVGMPLLQVFLRRTAAGEWRFLGATGLVDFPLGGWPLASALARALIPAEVAA